MGSIGEFDNAFNPNNGVANQWIWNAKVPTCAESTVHELIAQRVREQPDAPAVCSWNGCLTYQELEELSSRLACHLVDKMKIQEGAIVPLCFEKSMWTPVAMLAVMKTGAASVALDVTLPQQRLQSIIKQVQSTVILCSQAQRHLAVDLCAGHVFTVDYPGLDVMQITGVCLPKVDCSNTLYVVFTSGSTGTPKGVMITHSNISSGIRHQNALGYSKATRVFDFASYAFDAAWLNFLHSTVSGACLCIPSETDRRENVAKCMNEMKVDFALLTPSIARVIDPASVPTLETLVLGGEALAEVDITTWASRVDLRNAYGPAECSIVATTARIHSTEQSGNIGYGIGLNPWVVEVEGHALVPLGSVGELWLEGPLVGKGYLNDRTKTAASFVESPSWLQQGLGYMSGRRGRLYRTGDLVRHQEDGSLVFVGRKDSQIKIRGQRVELGDIEHHVQSGLSSQLQGPAVAIIASPNDSDKSFLVVFLTVSRLLMESYSGKRGMVQDLTTDLHDKLVEELPMYMVPSAYIPLAQMPMTPTGKMDRRQLQIIANSLTVDQLVELHPKWTGQREPVTEIEKRLRELWAQVLNIKPSSIGLDDTFFSHGGDSITAIQLSAKCRAAGFVITIPQIFRHKSLEDLAAKASPLPSLRTRPKIEPDNERFALSPAQQYFFENHPNGNNHFNQSFFLRLTRRVDLGLLDRSLRQLVSWHPLLRARFIRPVGGTWMQSIRQEADRCYHYGYNSITDPDQVRSVLNAAQRKLDIEKGPLIAFELIETSDSQLLFLVAHHLVVDLVSWRIIIEELEELLTIDGTTRENPSLTFQSWCKMQETYSIRYLQPEKSLTFPVKLPSYSWWGLNPQQNTHTNAVQTSFVASKQVTEVLLGDANRAFDTRPVEILHAALLHSFARTFNDRPAPIVFSEGHGREAFDETIDLSKTVGWFTTIWPAHVECNGQNSVTEVVQRTKDARRLVPMNGWAYFASRYLNAAGKAMFKEHGLPEILFNFEGLYQQLEKPDSLFHIEAKPDGTLSDFSEGTRLSAIVDVTALVVDGCLKFEFLYNRHMTQRDGVERWITQYKESLKLAGQELVCVKPSYTACDFPLLALNDGTLKELNEEVLPELGIAYGEVEDIYPCSPMQQGILLSQAKNASWYNTQVVWRIRSFSSSPVSVPLLQRAWRAVVQQHGILRTFFTEGLHQNSYVDQVVLKQLEPEISYDCHEDGSPITASESLKPDWKGKSLHSLSLVPNSSGEVIARLDINHAITDAASMEILRRDLSLAYSGSRLFTTNASYREYIEMLQGLNMDQSQGFWMEYLKGVKASIFPSLHSDTPTDRTHVELPTTRVDRALQEKIHTFCETHTVTPSNIFQLAWALVLRCYLNDEAVCFGYIVSGRDAPVAHVEDIVGPFINMLVSRFCLDGNTTVLETLKDTQDHYLEALAHQHYPLASALNSLGMTGGQLFNTVLQVQRNMTAKDIQGSAISVDIVEYEDPMEFDISVTVTESDLEMDISMQYDVSFLTKAQATSLVDSFQRAVEQIVQLPNSKLDALDAIGHHDLARIWEWNEQPLRSNDVCVHTLFSKRVCQQPDAPAICAWDGNLTYLELDELSTSLAYRLLGLGIGPGSIVPLCFEKSVWTPVAVFGVMKTGAASVILDVTLPRQRLLSVVNQVKKGQEGRTVILSSTAQYNLARDASASPTICVDTLAKMKQSPEIDLPDVDPSNTLYVVFTSGSTGTSKGAMISHTNFSSGIGHQLEVLGHSPTSRVFDFVSYSFDVCWSNILHTLVAGGCLCTPSTSQLRNDINGALSMTCANYAILTPTVARFLDPSIISNGFKLALIGEKMTDQDVARWETQSHVELFNTYGPAECTVIDTVNRVSHGTRFLGDIGRGLGCNTWVVSPSDYQHLLPVGCTGELLLEGPLVGQGYLGDPTKTASQFIETPVWLKQGGATVPGREGRLYRTGDLVQYQNDGSLKFMGRRDDQVKIHGQRVELGDVEHHARQILEDQFPESGELVADIIQPNGRETALLVVFLAAGKEAGGSDQDVYPMLHPQTESLRGLLSTQLPIHMVPSSFIVVDRIPTTPTGKTDRRRLRELGSLLAADELTWGVPSQAGDRMPAMTSMELQLRELWAQVLQLNPSRINAHDSFLQIGGDSVGAMRLVGAARNQGLSLTVEKVFQSPRLRDMALVTGISHATTRPIPAFSLLSSSTHVDSLRKYVAQRCNVQVRTVQDIFPCTPLQEGLLALTAKRSGDYINQVTLKLSEETDLAQLMRAWEKVIRDTPILRTRIVDLPELGLVQTVMSEETTWQTGDNLSVCLKEDAQEPMGLGTPLSRFRVVKDGESGEVFIVWTIHHAVYDGWSLQLILDQVRNVYRDQEATALGPFQRFIQHAVRKEESKSHDEFWQQYLSSSDVTSFPSLQNASYRPKADAVVSCNLTDISWLESDSITSATIIRAAWAILQSQYTGATNVAFGAIVSGRQAPVPYIDRIAGPTFATVPLHVKVDKAQETRQLLQQIQHDAAMMIPFEQTGLQRIRQINADIAKASEFQTLLVIHPAAKDEESCRANDLWDVKATGAVENAAQSLNTFNNYSILLDCQLKRTGVKLSLSFDTNVVDESMMQRMVKQLEHIIVSICDQIMGSTLVKDVMTVNDFDFDDICCWNRLVPETHLRCVHDSIADQALKHPAKMAICSWDGSLTYQDLDQRSTVLARNIVSLIGPGSIIPLCFEKSMWTPVAMLAVMKTGAASVALDTTLPKQRLQSIVDQVKPPLILSSKAMVSLAADLLGDLEAGKVITVDNEGIKMLEAEERKQSLPIVDPSSTLYLVFTSGSTGTPKGAMISHANFSSGLVHQLKALRYDSDTRAFDFASYAFDVSRAVCLRILVAGGCLCIPNETDRRNNTAQAMRQLGVNYAHLTPTVSRLLRPSDVPQLRTLVLGGEPLAKDDIDRWCGHVSLINTYGPAESTSTNTTQEINSKQSPGIGRGVGCNTWIADSSNYNHLVPIGCPGELLIEGPLVGQGYLGDREKTESSFIDSPPWLLKAGRRGHLYRTGDLVKYNSDGSLVFLGRKDAQVKIRGQRMELGEIEHHTRSILAASGVQVSLAAGVANPQGSDATFVVVFLMLNKQHDQPENSLRSLRDRLNNDLNHRLPSYMIPQAYVSLDVMPTTATGKTDRRMIQQLCDRLTLDDVLRSEPESEDRQAPHTEMERRLGELWARILRIPIGNIFSGDSFLQIGGDSVGAMRLVGAVREQGLSLTVEDVFKSPRLCDMALVVKNVEAKDQIIAPFSLLGLSAPDDVNSWRGRVASLCNVKPDQIEDAFPCTQLQQGVFALSEKRVGDYINQVVLQIDRSKVSVDQMKQAWKRAIQMIPILRTRIIDVEGHGIMQTVISEEDPLQSKTECSLASYVERDLKTPMVFGKSLSRIAFVEEDTQRSNNVGNQNIGAVYLVWTMHHAVYDGWTMDLILSQVRSLYCEKDDVHSLEPFQKFIQYSLQSDEDEEAFWDKYLENIDLSPFPTLPSSSYEPQADALLQHEIKNLAWRCNDDITASTVMRTAWGILLSCYTASPDVLFGTTVTGRQAPVAGIENIAGPTLATVPVRVGVDKDVTVQDLLRQVQKESLDMVPFEQTGLQRIRRISPNTNRGCQFQTLVVVQPRQKNSVAEEEALWQVVRREDKDTSSFNSYAILAECQLKQEGARIDVSFDSRVIEKDMMSRMLQQLEYILRLLCTSQSNELRVADLDLAGPEDMRSIWSWNSSCPAAYDLPVHEMIVARARQTSDAPAVCAWNGNLTFRELDDLSTCLAIYLLSQNPCAGTIIPLCFEKSMWTPVAMLAVMKTGAAAVALDVELPKQRLQSIVSQVNPVMILCSAAKYDLANEFNAGQVITVDRERLDSMKNRLINGPDIPLPVVDPSSILYIVFTSGSTGAPKGVMVSHGNFSTAYQHQNDALGYASSKRILDFSSYAFDAAWLNFLHSTISGACLCIPAEEARKTNVAACIDQMRVDFALLTPSVARMVDSETVPTLRTLVLGGEAHNTADVTRWNSHRVDLRNAYGPAECTVVATVTQLSKAAPRIGNIGRGFGLNTWIIDTAGSNHLVPVGVVGELCLEGPLVAQGYLGDSKKTAESFIKDPSWLMRGMPGIYPGRQGLVYRTGDLVRYNHDGTLSFMGRKDSQVKINGQRVELDDVEHHVRQAITTPFQGSLVAEVFVPREGNHSILAVFITIEGGITMNRLLDGMGDRLMDRLPEYMIPTVCIPMDELPMTATGKTDRRKLRETGSSMTIGELASLQPSQSSEPPSSDMEWHLHRLWSELLNIDPSLIGRKDSFFAFGGDSITAMQLCAKCRTAGMSLTVPQVFRHKTIARLASVVTVDAVVERHSERNDTGFALSPIQQMFFKYEPLGHDHFNQSVLLRLTRSLPSVDMTQAIESLLIRHSMLRAQFYPEADGVWTQRIPATIRDTAYIYRSHDIASLEDSVSLISQSQTSLNIRQGPLVAVDLFTTEKDGQYLSLVVHHLAIDLVSWRILLGDLEELLTTDQLSSCAPISFQAWCEGQLPLANSHVGTDTLASSESLPRAADYWEIDLSENVYGSVLERSFTICPDYVKNLLDSSNNAYRTQPVEIFHAALLYSFAQVFHDRQAPSILSEEHGRQPRNSGLDPSGTVGWFTTLRSIAVTLDIGESFEDALRKVKDARRRKPTSVIGTCPSAENTPQGCDMAEIIFNYSGLYQQLERPDALFHLAEAPSGALPDIAETVHRFALIDVSAFVKDGCLHFKFAYNRSIKHQGRISQWISQCKSLLEEAASMLPRAPQKHTLSDFPLLPLNDYDELDMLIQHTLPLHEIQPHQVEDIYPCSPVQQGILLSQAKNENQYWTRKRWEVESSSRVCPWRFQGAWQKVVDRHPILRTVFIDSASTDAYQDQMVLKSVTPEVQIISIADDDLDTSLARHQSSRNTPHGLPHALSVFVTTSGRVICDLLINHAIIDGMSMGLIENELELAYDDALSAASAPPYSDYIAHIRAQSAEAARTYWQEYLAGVSPCILQQMTDYISSRGNVERLPVLHLDAEVDSSLRDVCKLYALTPSNVFQVAWGLVLRAYTGNETSCFGYLTSGRDAPIDDIQSIAGPFINMLVSRIDLSHDMSVLEIMQQNQSEHLRKLEHQHLPLAEILHSLPTSMSPLFNTAMSVQSGRSGHADNGTSTVSLQDIGTEDPGEYDIAINVFVEDAGVQVNFRYCASAFSEQQAVRIRQLFIRVLREVVLCPLENVGQLNIIRDGHMVE